MSPSYVLGINPGFGGFNYHDPAACLLVDGELVAAVEEERFTRTKSAPGVFPHGAVDFCLRHAGIGAGDLDAIAVGYGVSAWRQRLALETARIARAPRIASLLTNADAREEVDEAAAMEALARAGARIDDLLHRAHLFGSEERAAARIRALLPGSESVPVRFVQHHDAHAISAFLPAHTDAATVVVLDGLGEIETASAWRATGDRVERVRTERLPNSIGYFYAAITHFLGFKGWLGEGKTMALAPYGSADPDIVAALDSLVDVTPDGFDVTRLVEPCLGEALALDLDASNAMLAQLFGVPPRPSSAPLEDVHRDIAWAAQSFLERSVSAFARAAIEQTGEPFLAFAGGVALNCKLNLVLRDLPEVEGFWVQPICHDAGMSIGSAFAVAQALGTRPRQPRGHLAFGPGAQEDVDDALSRYDVPFEEPDDVAETVARLLAGGAVVMWYDGRSEMGPRALGSRSILADPRREDMKLRINEEIKQREVWRPFGPSVLMSHAHEVLEIEPDEEAPYMVVAYRVRPEWRDRVPAVVHEADGTTRPQTVSATALPRYHAVISRFHELTGVPLVLNTSMNGRGEPLVTTPEQALRLFFTSAADVLVLDGRVVPKAHVRGAEQREAVA